MNRARRRCHVLKHLTHPLLGCIRLVAFILVIMKDSIADENSACDEEFVSGIREKQGEFSTPEWPSSYPSNTRCRLKFRAADNEVVWISWGEFHLEDPLPDSKQCLRDYVEVIVIDLHNQHHVSGRYCGDNVPPEFKTMQRAVDIIFQSSFTKHYKGFSGSYKFIPEKEVQPPLSIYPGVSNPNSKNCGGFAQGKYGGEIKNPGYPDTYPANVECNWVIRVRPGKQIYINLVELELTKNIAECKNAKVVVIDGYAHVHPGKGATETLSQEQFIEFCGDKQYLKVEGQKSYMSEKNRMVVKFTTSKGPGDAILNERKRDGKPVGFRLVWTEVSVVDPDSAETCKDFYCRGGRHCIEQGQNVCIPRKRYCIDRSLVCDGMPNCAESDNSDEENCYSYEIVGAGASVFCFLVLVIFFVICCQRRRNRKQLLRMHDRNTPGQATEEMRNSLPNGRNRQKLNSGRKPFDSNELKVLPMNYHGYKEEEEAGSDSQPFLVPNHLPQNPPHAIPHSAAQPPSFHYVMSPEEAELSGSMNFTDTRRSHRRTPDPVVHYHPGEKEDIWQYRKTSSDLSRRCEGCVEESCGQLPQPPPPIVEFHQEPGRHRSEDLSVTSPSEDSSGSVRNRRPPPVPLKPILKSSISGPSSSSVSGVLPPTRQHSHPGTSDQVHSGKKAPVPPPRVDSKTTSGLNEEIGGFSGVVYAKPGKTVGFAPISAGASGPIPVQRTPIPPPLQIPDSVTPGGNGTDRSPSPWHHRTRPTEV